MEKTVVFRPYLPTNKPACLGIFDANCPAFFAPNERDEYADFLLESPSGYEVCVIHHEVVGAFGLLAGRLNWMLIDPKSQGLGIGSAAMARVMTLAMSAGHKAVEIATSHKTAPFFAKFGAVTQEVAQDGWGPGMHRVDMTLPILTANVAFKPCH